VNFKLVLKAYSILRQLADDESALLDTLRTLTDTERDLLVESLSPAKSTKKATKKSASKSSRASGMAAAIGKSLNQQRAASAKCVYVSEDGDDPTECGELEGNGIHDPALGYRNYHPFAPSSPASTAHNQSSASNGERSGTVSSVGETISAGSAAGGSSE
jgi:hypothetical protein